MEEKTPLREGYQPSQKGSKLEPIAPTEKNGYQPAKIESKPTTKPPPKKP